jgi:lysozyme family protein
VHVPKGRGPFASWEAAAIDALDVCPPHASRWTDWSAGGALTLLEQYNGLGYAARGLPSPYLWAHTDQYVSGKYVADGHFDPNAIDHQLGCAVLLKAMKAIDASITL